MILADGMGSGDAARRESALTCRLLRQFLEADIQPEAALTTLNSAMALRGAETGQLHHCGSVRAPRRRGGVL